MIKCPECKKEITELNYDSCYWRTDRVTIDIGEDLYFENVKDWNAEHSEEGYYCPECNKKLFDMDEYDTAYKFLNGEVQDEGGIRL